MPAYMFNDRSSWTFSYKGNLSSYNNEFGTNFTNNEGNGTAWAQWNYQFFLQPQYGDMISSMHSATNAAADELLQGLLMVLPIRKLGLLTKGVQL